MSAQAPEQQQLINKESPEVELPPPTEAEQTKISDLTSPFLNIDADSIDTLKKVCSYKKDDILK